jgi:hypothetical protein
VCLILEAEIIDRVAITVANQVITESELKRQARIAAFPKPLPTEIPREVLRATVDRLIEQALIQREMELSRYPAPQSVEADAELEKLKKRLFSSEQEYQTELKRAGITEEELKRHLLRQLTMMRFIDFRFRPGIQVSSADIEEYYKRQFAGKGVPFEEARAKIDQILTEERINEALDRWLSETRAQTYITYNPEVLR